MKSILLNFKDRSQYLNYGCFDGGFYFEQARRTKRAAWSFWKNLTCLILYTMQAVRRLAI